MPKEDTQFKKGNKYGGRKKGSKNKISKVALNAIYRDLTDNAGDKHRAIEGYGPIDVLARDSRPDTQKPGR